MMVKMIKMSMIMMMMEIMMSVMMMIVMTIVVICSGEGDGVDGGYYDHVDGDGGDGDQTFHMISVLSNVTPLQVTCSNS